MPIANVTNARFKQHALYLKKDAYERLGITEGDIAIRIGDSAAVAFMGRLKPLSQGRQGYLVCHQLYVQLHPAMPDLPLQLGDQVEYETGKGWLRVAEVCRAETRVLPAEDLPQADAELVVREAVEGELLPAYLSANRARIVELGPQNLPEWSDNYNGWNNPILQRLYEKFPERTLNRDDVASIFRDWEDPALALVAMAVWGLIKPGDLRRMLTHTEPELVEKLSGIRELVRAGKLRDAFVQCSDGGTFKIRGIATSYFTKIFFFLGLSDPDVKQKPLVLDKWTKNAYFLLRLQQTGMETVDQQFRIPSLKKFIEDDQEIWLRGGVARQASTYADYVHRMNAWAREIGVTPGKLEQFVFGVSRRDDSSLANPRVEILREISRYLAPA